MKDKEHLKRVLDIIRQNLHQEMFSKFSEDVSGMPTNNISGGKIAGSVEAGDDPPVRKRKKYIYMKGVRKMWKPENGRAS